MAEFCFILRYYFNFVWRDLIGKSKLETEEEMEKKWRLFGTTSSL